MRDGSRIVGTTHPLAIDAQTHRAEDTVDERIAIPPVCAEMRAIIKLNGEHRPERRGIAEHEVNVLGRDLIECPGIGPTVQVLTKIREPDLRKDEIPASRR